MDSLQEVQRENELLRRRLADLEGRMAQYIPMAEEAAARREAEALVAAQRDLARLLSSVPTEQDAWSRCLEITLQLTGMDSGGIYLFTDDQSELFLVAHRGLSDSFLQASARYPRHASNVQVILSGESLYLSNRDFPLSGPLDREGLGVIASLPISSQGRILGCVNVASHSLVQFSPFARRALETIAAEIGAIALFYKTAAALRARDEKIHKELEARVRQQTAEVQDLYDNAPIGYHSLDEGGRMVRVNRTWCGLLGYPVEEIKGRRLQEFLAPSSQFIFQERFTELKAHGWLKDLELELVRVDGSLLPVVVNATAIYDDQGQYVMSRSTAVDIHEHKQADQALRASEEQNRLLFEASPDAITLLDLQGIILRSNHAFAEMTGIPVQQMLGKSLFKLGLISREESIQVGQKVMAALEADKNFIPAEFVLYKASGEEINVEGRIFPFKIGGEVQVLMTSRDGTLHKLTEAVYRRANEELERAMRMKVEFMSNMSHELRTPLTGILGFAESLQMQTYGTLNDRQVRALEKIEASGRHLLELINDILDLTRLESGDLSLDFESFSLGMTCQASLQAVQGMARRKNQSVSYSMDPQEINLLGDAMRIKQLLVNLLSNAVKYTPQGGELGLEVVGEESLHQVELIVWDKGIGIQPEDQERLFQPFTQIDSGLAREYSGTGLGLVLVKNLAQVHSGSVSVESVHGEGSRFIVSLPWFAKPLV
jgi:PAS domain S-box-containing protein